MMYNHGVVHVTALGASNLFNVCKVVMQDIITI